MTKQEVLHAVDIFQSHLDNEAYIVERGGVYILFDKHGKNIAVADTVRDLLEDLIKD